MNKVLDKLQERQILLNEILYLCFCNLPCDPKPLHPLFSPVLGLDSEASPAWQYKMMRKKLQKLFLVCIVIWMMIFFILSFHSPDSDLTFFHNVATPPSIEGFMKIIDVLYVENSTSTEHLKKKDLARTVIPSLMLQDWSFDEFWADKVVRGLWMGWASSVMLSSRLQKAKKYYSAINLYRVKYSGHRKRQRNKKQLWCQLKQQGIFRTLTGSEEPFASLGWQRLVPRRPLEQAISGRYMTCAVVSSAGAILNSSLGREIGEWLGLGCKQV